MAFFPVLELSASRVPVGVLETGAWAYVEPDGSVHLLAGRYGPFLVTLLEWEDRLLPALAAGLEAQGLPVALTQSFPTHTGVRLGLTWRSEYWQRLALRWLEREGSAAHFLTELRALVTEGQTQQIRHLAQRLLRATTSTF